MTIKIAVPLADTPSVCTLPNGSRMATARAKNLGYQIADRAALEAAATTATETPRSGTMKAKLAYATAIEALPEARNRPSAAAGLWSSHTVETMPLEKAASFLRGLPEEDAPLPKVAAQSPIDPQLMHRFRRKLDLRIMGLNMKADQGGDPKARDTARRMSQAISIRDRTGCSFGEAFTNVGLPARETISSLLS